MILGSGGGGSVVANGFVGESSVVAEVVEFVRLIGLAILLAVEKRAHRKGCKRCQSLYTAVQLGPRGRRRVPSERDIALTLGPCWAPYLPFLPNL